MMDIKIKQYIEDTELTLQAIADTAGTTYKVVYRVWRTYSAAYRKARKVKNYRRSKAGDKNPMFNKHGKLHHNFKGIVSDNKGYLMVLKPNWFTGRKGSKHVFQHTIVLCEAEGKTELTKGQCIHHCDQNPQNNEYNNLIVMELGEHIKLHRLLGSATTISKESTAKWLEAVRCGDTYDIVSSA